MNDNTNSKLFAEYSRIAVVADALGFSYEDVDSYLFKIMSSDIAKAIYQTKVGAELALRILLFRLDMRKDEFERHLEENRISYRPITHEDLDKMLKVSGKYALAAYDALLTE